MDPEKALELVKHDSNLLLLDVPQYTLFGIDTQVFSVGPEFKGIKMIPPGIHFLFYSSSNKDGKEFSPIIGFFIDTSPSEVWLLVQSLDYFHRIPVTDGISFALVEKSAVVDVEKKPPEKSQKLVSNVPRKTPTPLKKAVGRPRKNKGVVIHDREEDDEILVKKELDFDFEHDVKGKGLGVLEDVKGKVKAKVKIEAPSDSEEDYAAIYAKHPEWAPKWEMYVEDDEGFKNFRVFQEIDEGTDIERDIPMSPEVSGELDPRKHAFLVVKNGTQLSS